MRVFSDVELITELSKRLQAKDNAYHDLVTMAKKLEAVNERLLESERVKSHFLSNIRNEINNPLTSVLTMSEMILSKNGLPDYSVLQTVVSMIYKEAFSLNFQLRNIFTAAELEAGETVLSGSSVDIDSFVRDVMNTFEHRSAEKRLSVCFELSAELKADPFFRTDAEKMHRVLSNLVSNAIEYSHEGGTVEIKAGKKGGNLDISVKDGGIGIDAAYHKEIFERFKQLDSGITKNHGGHGLGLSVVKAVLESLNGTIGVKSGKGEGSTFTVSVPEMDPSEADRLTMDGADFFMGDNDGSERI